MDGSYFLYANAKTSKLTMVAKEGAEKDFGKVKGFRWDLAFKIVKRKEDVRLN